MAANPERGPVGVGECFSALVQWRDASVANFTDSTEYRYSHESYLVWAPDPSDRSEGSGAQTTAYLYKVSGSSFVIRTVE